MQTNILLHMDKIHIQTWASGPTEILEHGIKLIEKDTDTNHRLSMILIDNSVELILKTFLALPKRITGVKISRKKYQEISESFPALLDAIEHHANKRLDGIDLGAIEWYHRLRNELYHHGIGLTIERDKVVVYSELAKLLLRNLFGIDIIIKEDKKTELLGKLIAFWSRLETALYDMAFEILPTGFYKRKFLDTAQFLKNAGLMSKKDFNELNKIRKLRNEVVHGIKDYKEVIKEEHLNKLEKYINEYQISEENEK